VIAALAALSAAAAIGAGWVAFRRLWWRRVHCHSPLGPTVGLAEVLAAFADIGALGVSTLPPQLRDDQRCRLGRATPRPSEYGLGWHGI